jgi:glucose/arabinose dehydrogenase
LPTGYKIVRIPLNEQGAPQGKVEDFITGWLPDHNRRQVMGRPVGVIFGRDGAMYISDDDAGVVYRVTYTAK